MKGSSFLTSVALLFHCLHPALALHIIPDSNVDSQFTLSSPSGGRFHVRQGQILDESPTYTLPSTTLFLEDEQRIGDPADDGPFSDDYVPDGGSAARCPADIAKRGGTDRFMGRLLKKTGKGSLRFAKSNPYTTGSAVLLVGGLATARALMNDGDRSKPVINNHYAVPEGPRARSPSSEDEEQELARRSAQTDTEEEDNKMTMHKRAILAPLFAQFSMKAILKKSKAGGTFVKENPKATSAAALVLAGFSGFELLKTKLGNHQTIDVYHHILAPETKGKQRRMLPEIFTEEVEPGFFELVGDPPEGGEGVSVQEVPLIKRRISTAMGLGAIASMGLGGRRYIQQDRSYRDEHEQSKEMTKYYKTLNEKEAAELAALRKIVKADKGDWRQGGAKGQLDTADTTAFVRRQLRTQEEQAAGTYFASQKRTGLTDRAWSKFKAMASTPRGQAMLAGSFLLKTGLTYLLYNAYKDHQAKKNKQLLRVRQARLAFGQAKKKRLALTHEHSSNIKTVLPPARSFFDDESDDGGWSARAS